jgi:DNA-3-methyladenine glycosylase
MNNWSESHMEKLNREFYNRNSLIVAKELLGKYLVNNIQGIKFVGKIVEVEAYMGPEDKAAHSYNNRLTERTEIMYGDAGYAYVYFIYGMHFCMNVVVEAKGKPQAVLIRALEPISPMEDMAERRYNKTLQELKKSELISLTNGPGKLCKAMGIIKEHNGEDLCGKKLYITQGENQDKFNVVSAKRINIDYAEEAKDYPWRYYIENNSYISKK